MTVPLQPISPYFPGTILSYCFNSISIFLSWFTFSVIIPLSLQPEKLGCNQLPEDVRISLYQIPFRKLEPLFTGGDRRICFFQGSVFSFLSIVTFFRMFASITLFTFWRVCYRSIVFVYFLVKCCTQIWWLNLNWFCFFFYLQGNGRRIIWRYRSQRILQWSWCFTLYTTNLRECQPLPY